MAWLTALLRELLHWLDYEHIRWGLRERLKPHTPGFLEASRRLYEYRRTYGWK